MRGNRREEPISKRTFGAHDPKLIGWLAGWYGDGSVAADG
jgi:hypothetical protein